MRRTPRGLKARDPTDAARAAAALDRAMALSDQALRRARALREAGVNVRTLAILMRMMRDLAAIEDAVEAAARANLRKRATAAAPYRVTAA